MRKFTLTLRHDNGTITITTWASTSEQAIQQVLDFEGAPRSALVSIRS